MPAAAVEEHPPAPVNTLPGARFHALFTSHHLISPKKRRSLQQWSNSLAVAGFAKVGYPGVIYAQGEQSSVEEFVDNVRAMQWLALRLRFLELLPVGNGDEQQADGWTEFEKVGEAVEAMRRLGLENWIVEMGVGSRST
jgi:molybdenum cofactor biosynthesis enzyme MoaA